MFDLLMKKALVLPILFLSLATFLVSCDKDDALTPEDVAKLNGRWLISSYKLAGTEYIGVLVESGAIAFSPEGENEGTFIQVVKFFDEEEISIQGPYQVDLKKGQIRLEYDDVVIVADIEIVGNDLKWASVQDGFPLDLVATKQP